MDFYKLYTIIVSLILAIMLIFFGVMIYNSKYDAKFPPVVSECPNYWETLPKDDGSGNECVNTKKIGNKSCETKIDFSGPNWTGVNGMCQKQTWSRQCNQVWDGVTNIDNAC